MIGKLLFGGPVVEWLNIEQPDVRNLRADMLARGSGKISRHVELQTKTDPEMGFRELEYYVGFRRLMKEEVEQWVVYAGKEPLRMDPFFESPSTHHKFQILNLREMDGISLLESDDWGDNELALLTRANREKVIQVVETRLRQLQGEEQSEAARTFVLISGILGIEVEIERRLRTGMIDIMENKVLGPAIQQGMEQGMKQGMTQLLQAQLERRFGQLPSWASEELQKADQKTLEGWSLRLLDAGSLKALFQ